ncbi:hypothetical protein vBVpaMR16F_14 [Vibrio phage vB_VpaM_R16F]|nr:hypothetical protein vBVpaMR16F_14 [Vibrio phage vB_VpaM_R16F]
MLRKALKVLYEVLFFLAILLLGGSLALTTFKVLNNINPVM